MQLRNCTELAARRGSRSITINDLIFQIRHDAPKVSRLRTFLSWKEVRKNVKDSDDKAGDADLAAAEDPVGGVVAGAPVDDAAKKNKKARVGLPWEPLSFYNQEVPEREDEEDEEEEEMNYITLQRLRKADERTKVMTREEYVTWSEFRQASFTYRKSKRFREWVGFSTITDGKPSDDIVDILGFLTFEMVQTLTEEALRIKDHEDLLKERTGEDAGTKKRKLAQGLFDPPSEGRSPVESRHIQEAFRRLQARPTKLRAMLNGTSLQQRTNLKLVCFFSSSQKDRTSGPSGFLSANKPPRSETSPYSNHSDHYFSHSRAIASRRHLPNIPFSFFCLFAIPPSTTTLVVGMRRSTGVGFCMRRMVRRLFSILGFCAFLNYAMSTAQKTSYPLANLARGVHRGRHARRRVDMKKRDHPLSMHFLVVGLDAV